MARPFRLSGQSLRRKYRREYVQLKSDVGFIEAEPFDRLTRDCVRGNKARSSPIEIEMVEVSRKELGVLPIE